jgi:hypothetical protein
VREANGYRLARYMADRAPTFYRDPRLIIEKIRQGYPDTAMQAVYRRLPTREGFQKSHFGEILSAVFAEEQLEWRPIYSKLSVTTSENSNANKMDVLMYVPDTNPLKFVFIEVKSSQRICLTKKRAYHNSGCYKDLFDTLEGHSENDKEFDLDAVESNIDKIRESDRDIIRDTLVPYGPKIVTYAGFCVIDASTKDDGELQFLALQPHSKDIDVDVIAIDNLPKLTGDTWARLDRIRRAYLEDDEDK